jgi:hypothetical protein
MLTSTSPRNALFSDAVLALSQTNADLVELADSPRGGLTNAAVRMLRDTVVSVLRDVVALYRPVTVRADRLWRRHS